MRDLIRLKIVDGIRVAVPEFTRRDVREPRVKGKAIAVIGPRRAGKTTYLWQVIATAHAQGTPREGLVYFSFEDERLAGMGQRDLELLVQEYYALYPEWRERRCVTWLFDEIQNVPGWETFVRRLMDSENVRVYVSGSSARLLSREVASALRGRAMEARVYPFSFREYLRHRGCEPREDARRLGKAERAMLEKRLCEYLRVGGYPEVQGVEERDRYELLRGYVDSVMLRDVIERYGVTQPMALRWLVRQLLGAPAGKFSVHRFYATLRGMGVAIGKDTVYRLVEYLEDAFLIRTVGLATESVRRRMVNPRKVYPIDPGYIAVYDRSGRMNEGHALETVVALELERRGYELSYVVTAEGFEVDFLAVGPRGERELIQVCAEMDDEGTVERECRAIRAAQREIRGVKGRIVVLRLGATEVPDGIEVVPAYQWLLGERLEG